MKNRLPSYDKFWPFYLGEHSKPATRAMHIGGTYAAFGAAAAAIVTGTWWLPLAGLGVTYACAWVSHFFIEKNKPATFTHPLWSFVSDLRMAGLWGAGKLKKEFNKFGIPYKQPKTPTPAPAATAPAP